MADLLLRVQSRLTARDLTLLGWLFDHGLLTTPQIAYALFPSLDFAQRRLLKLRAAGLIDRFRPQKPDGGSYPYYYVIDQLGAEVVATQRGAEPPRRDHARNRKRQLTRRTNLDHLTGVNQFFVDLAGHARIRSNAALLRWWPETRCKQMGAFATATLTGGDFDALRARYLGARPDGHGVWREDSRTVWFFLEHDTGTEALHELTGKLTSYERFAFGGGPSWPVLFWLHSATRQIHLHQHLARRRPTVPVATAARGDTTHGGLSPADAVWWLHGAEDGPYRLADLATRRSERSPSA